MRALLRRSIDRGRTPVAKKNSTAGAHWTPETHELLVCDNGKDNIPVASLHHDTTYLISQCRSSSKEIGQDAMATASHEGWVVDVLCDGHDLMGHDVARAVCKSLPPIVLRRVIQRPDSNAKIEKQLLLDAFEECANSILWTSEGIRCGMFVRVFGGEWEGKLGYIADMKDPKEFATLVIVDEDGYHRPQVMTKFLKRSKYTGGCTCVCLVRNLINGYCSIATAGDSRALLMFGKIFDDDVLRPEYGLGSGDTDDIPMAMTSPAHNVFNKSELLRLNTEHEGSFEVDGAFLVNPVTKFAIQPTRGLGDHDMYNTGYLNIPEVSECFKLKPGSMVFLASDGVFDDHVWNDDEIISFFDMHGKSDTTDITALAKKVYHETLQRSLSGGYVDDISLLLFKVKDYTAEGYDFTDTSSEASSELADPENPARRKSLGQAGSRKSILRSLWRRKNKSENDESLIKTKPNVEAPSKEDRRKTIDRKDRGSFSSLIAKALEAQDQENNPENEELANVVLNRFATKYGHDIQEINANRKVKEDAAKAGKRLSSKRTEGKK